MRYLVSILLVTSIMLPRLALADPWTETSTTIYATDTSKFIGIGGTSPYTKLDIRGTSANTASTLQIVGNGVSTLLLGQDSDGGVIRGQGGNSVLKFLVGGSGDQAASGSGTEAMRINSSGYLGIGTTGPSNKLSVYTTTNADGISLDGTTNPAIVYRNSGTIKSYQGVVTSAGSWFTDSSVNDMVFRSESNKILFGQGSGNSTMAINAGNVGIGTTGPATKLDVNGSITVNNIIYGPSGSALALQSQSGKAMTFSTDGGNERMRIASDGNVGIGNTSPDNKLVVNEGDNTNWAIKATSNSTSKGAIIGTASYSSSSNVNGIWGETYAPGSSTGSSIGVRGDAYAETDTGGAAFGVLGYNHATDNSGTTSRPAGVYGGAYGPYGISGSGAPAVFDSHGLQIDGVQGETFANEAGSSGVYGAAHSTSTKVYGVAGYTSSESGGGAGVFGLHVPGSGVGKGVFGQSNSGDAGAYGVYFSGGLGGTGTKSAVVYTDIQGPTEMYALETPGNWFEDIGEGQLINGEATVKINPIFLQTVTIDGDHPMEVFIQSYSKTEMYVERGTDSFTVYAKDNPTSSDSFGYRIIAKRQYYEDRRMRATPVEIDAPMRPDLTDAERAVLNERWGGN